MATLSLPRSGGEIIAVPLIETRQVTADLAGGASVTIPMPFKGRVVGAVGFCSVIGGSTEFTDIDLTVQNASNSDANMLTGVIPVVDSSAIVRTSAVHIGPNTTIASARFAVGDNIELVVDITGGSSPTANGVGVLLLVVREE